MELKYSPRDPNASFLKFSLNDCESVNPLKYFERERVENYSKLYTETMTMMPDFSLLSPISRINLINRVKNQAKSNAQADLEKLYQTVLDEKLISLLTEKKKKTHQKILSQLVFESDTIMALAAHAWRNLRMPYSRYTFEYPAKELAGKVYPVLLYKDEPGKFCYHGLTNLTEAEMQVALDKRHRVISDIIGDSNNWCCFFRTLSGINGVEVPHVGFPHLHYISSAWGIPRADVLANLSSYRYTLRSETIPFKKSKPNE